MKHIFSLNPLFEKNWVILKHRLQHSVLERFFYTFPALNKPSPTTYIYPHKKVHYGKSDCGPRKNKKGFNY